MGEGGSVRKIGDTLKRRKRTTIRQRIRNMNLDEFTSVFNERLIPDNATGCLNWVRRDKGARYGYCWNPIKKKHTSTHRTAMELHLGRPLSTTEHVLHKCDNGFCCNPEHLFIGNHKENMIDMARKGRTGVLIGEQNTQSKLTEKQVMEILTKYKPWKYGTPRLAKEYGVTQGVIMAIVSGRSWKKFQAREAA
jgi:hypothetical protein